MHVGVVLPQSKADWPEVLEEARFAESLGADSVWVVDHVLSLRPEAGILEAWTLMSALAASTERVEIGAQVLCQSFRNPALLAKMAATLDRVSGGRLRLLVGAGWFQQEYEAFGWDFPSPGVLVEQLRETVAILKGLLSGKPEPFTFEGTHYWVNGAVNAPQPVRSPLPIEVGGARDRVLRTVARDADGWNCPSIALPLIRDRIAFLTEQCERSGRSIKDLRLTCQIVCAVGDDELTTKPELAMFGPDHGLVGSVDQAVQRAGELMEQGVEGFHVITARGDRGRACLERLVNEVRPQLISEGEEQPVDRI